jgi:hypothetical protein
MMLFHIISGPLSLFFDIYDLIIYKCISIGGILKLIKILTVVRDIIMGAIFVFPILIPVFLGIISSIFVVSIWALICFKDKIESIKIWEDFNRSVFSFI